ncbi:MAG TPA: hypothetical protein VGD98_24690 [Ktedonobacteraceae bacterium]
MQRSFLGRLQRTALFSLGGALLLLLVVPALQLLVLGPQGYGTALASPQSSLAWIQAHTVLFLLYRFALLLGFTLLLGLPFALFRIIVAQEIIGRAELAGQEEDEEEDEEEDAEERSTPENEKKDQQGQAETGQDVNGMPDFAWRGKGFAVLAAWTGLAGLVLSVAGVLISTIYLWSSTSTPGVPGQVPDNFANVTSICAILTYTLGGGLLALSCIFFGLVIARSGRKLWPDGWIAFSYVALVTGAITSGSAVQVAFIPGSDQATLTTPAIFLFALWSLWFSIMVIRLKAE